MQENTPSKFEDKLNRFGTWLLAWCKENLDFAFVLAVFTETPRWTVTFMAINEPLVIGVPLGVLLAFATSKVWKHYFQTKSWSMLVFNILAIVLAVAVISPVLYAMTEATPKEVDIANVLRDWQWRAAWAVALALTTFVPLVQLAVVHGATTQAQPASKADLQPTEMIAAEVAPMLPDAIPAQPEQPALIALPQPDLADRVAQLQGEGLKRNDIIDQLLSEGHTGAAIASALQIHPSAVSRRKKEIA